MGKVKVKGMHVSQPRPAKHSLDDLPGTAFVRDSGTLPNDQGSFPEFSPGTVRRNDVFVALLINVRLSFQVHSSVAQLLKTTTNRYLSFHHVERPFLSVFSSF